MAAAAHLLYHYEPAPMNIKDLARALLPEPVLTALVARHARRHSHRLNAEWGL